MKQIDKVKRLVVFDVETTGLNPKVDEIIDFGAVVCERKGEVWHVVENVNTLVQTTRPISPEIVEITGITTAMSVTGIAQHELARTVERLLAPGTLVVAYNLQFDIAFVDALMHRFGAGFKFACDVLDMMTVYKDTHPYPHRLENALERFGIDNVSAHRAHADAVATWDLLVQMQESHDIDAYINVIGYHSRYGLKGPRYDHVVYVPQTFTQGSVKAVLSKRR